MQLFSDFTKNVSELDHILRPDASFDLVKRPVKFAGKDAVLYFIDGFIKDEIMEKIMEFLMKLKPEEINPLIPNTTMFADSFVPYVEMSRQMLSKLLPWFCPARLLFCWKIFRKLLS